VDVEAEMIAAFERDGYLVLRDVVPPAVLADCRREWTALLRAEGVDPDDRSTWTRPVVRVWCPETAPFAAAGTQPALWETYDQLLGPGTWCKRQGVGGSIPVRFPSDNDPGDAGWHIDGSYASGDTYWVNVASRERGLLALFLLTDVDHDDAPTEIKIGSHLDIPPLLEPFGDAGTSFFDVARLFRPSTLQRPSAFATGRAGDVYVCHPFLVHRATWPHRGHRLRAIAQPGVALHEPFPLDGDNPYPVERAILAGLGQA
jgi:Phytanoyl-CoA dioxygenase (PhyH)